MKFTKKLLTVLLVAVLALGSTLMVSAAGSTQGGMTSKTEGVSLSTSSTSNSYKGKYNLETPLYKVTFEDGKSTGEVTVEATGYEPGDKVAVLFVLPDGTTETVTATVAEDGTITLTGVEDGDQIAIVESDDNGKAIEKQSSEEKNGKNGTSSNSSSSSSSSSNGSSSSSKSTGSTSSSTSSSSSKSPKTGVEYTYVVLFAAAAVLGGSALALRKHN